MFSESFQHDGPPAPLDIGKTIGATFSAIGRNWRALLILATPFCLLPTAVMTYLIQSSVIGLQAAAKGSAAPSGEFFSTMLWIAACAAGFGLILQPLFIAAVAWTVWTDASGGRPGALAAVRAALPQLPWLILAGLLAGLAYLAGFLLLIVPGVMAAVAFSVTLPACAVERLGPVAAMRRSLELTRGQRWRLFGLFVVVWLLSTILSFAVSAAIMPAILAAPGAQLAVLTATNTLSTSITSIFAAIALGSVYVQLRTNREGAGAVSVAEVFA